MTVVRDSWLVFRRQIHMLLQSPAWVIAGALQPLFFVLLFAPLLPRVLGVADTGEAYRVFVPGLLVLLVIFSSLFAGLGLIGETRMGIIERCRITPVSRMALLVGRCGRDVVTVLLQATVIVGVATIFGMRVGIGDLALSYLLLAGVAVMLAALSYGLAIKLTREDTMSSVIQTATQPITLLSGVMLPLSLAPDWMVTVAWWNPLSHVVSAQRALFAGDAGSSTVWQATIVVGALAVLSLAWATRSFTRAAN